MCIRDRAKIIYANEADVLNVAMFGMTAKMWREQHPELKGNIRDYATIKNGDGIGTKYENMAKSWGCLLYTSRCV